MYVPESCLRDSGAVGGGDWGHEGARTRTKEGREWAPGHLSQMGPASRGQEDQTQGHSPGPLPPPQVSGPRRLINVTRRGGGEGPASPPPTGHPTWWMWIHGRPHGAQWCNDQLFPEVVLGHTRLPSDVQPSCQDWLWPHSSRTSQSALGQGLSSCGGVRGALQPSGGPHPSPRAGVLLKPH